MAATSLLALGATVCAGVGGYSLGRALLIQGGARKSMADALGGSKQQPVMALLQRGCAPLVPAAEQLLTWSAVRVALHDLIAVVERRTAHEGTEVITLGAASALSVILAAAAVVALVASVVTGSVVCGVACAVCAVLVLFTRVRTAQEKHIEVVRQEVPEALRSMSVCFRSGLSLLQTLQQVAQELDGSLGSLFDRAARRLEMGATTTEALSVFDSARQVPELRFVAVALDAQHQSGGSLVAVLESAQESVESELDLRRSLRVQTAQAKLSARIVTLMPFLLVALFSLMSPGFLEPFFSSFAGMALLALALGMQLAGTLMVQRMLKTNAD